jgi:hypothetical protein
MSKGIEFYEAVIKRVMDEGTIVSESDRVRTYKHPDKPDIDVEVDLSTGDTSSITLKVILDLERVQKFQQIWKMGPRAPKELMESELVYRPMGPEDYSKDWEEGIIEGGVNKLEEWIKMKRGYAAGGRVGMFRGGIPKGLAGST